MQWLVPSVSVAIANWCFKQTTEYTELAFGREISLDLNYIAF